jgi:hypothetical protein
MAVAVFYSSENKNEKVLAHYPKVLGIPHFYVLDKDGTLLRSQHVQELRAGETYDPNKMIEFLTKWSPPAAAKVTKTGCRLLWPPESAFTFRPDSRSPSTGFPVAKGRGGSAYRFPIYSSATLSAIAGASTSARFANTITVSRSSGKRSMAVRNPTVSP